MDPRRLCKMYRKAKECTPLLRTEARKFSIYQQSTVRPNVRGWFFVHFFLFSSDASITSSPYCSLRSRGVFPCQTKHGPSKSITCKGRHECTWSMLCWLIGNLCLSLHVRPFVSGEDGTTLQNKNRIAVPVIPLSWPQAVQETK